MREKKEKCPSCGKKFEDYHNRPVGEDRCEKCASNDFPELLNNPPKRI